MKRFIILAFFASLMWACQNTNEDVPATENTNFPKEVVEAESRKANEMFERAFNEAVDKSPERQSYLGIKKDYAEWDDRSADAAMDFRDLYQSYLQKSKDSIDIAKLSPETKMSYDLFQMYCQSKVDAFKWRNYSYLVNQMHGRQSRIPAFMINIHRITSYEDALAYLNRLDGVQGVIQQLIDQLIENEKAGVMIPRFVFDHVISDAKNVISGQPFGGTEDSAIYADFKKKVEKLDIKEGKKRSLILGAEKRLMGSVRPAYKKLIQFLNSQKVRATDEDGVWKFPNGEAFYKYKLKQMTTTDMTADEIHNLGLSEVKRIHGEMKDIMKQVGFTGTLQEFFTFMKESEKFYYSEDEAGKTAYMEDAKTLIENMKKKLDELFIVQPKAKLVVKAVEPFREKSAGKAFYQRPAPDGSRPGTYYANMYNMKAMPKYQMEALAYHEAIPGHHMQLSIAQELKGIPKFRKFGLRFTAYTEGWGLYSEFLPKEIGFYQDPYSDFGRLAMELWRACRLVVDTGIHAKKWTRQQGIDYYTQNTPNDIGDCIKMVERHIVMPAQATTYKIGMIKILELREKAKNKLGDKFDIRKFHDVILKNGELPLFLLEKVVDDYISQNE